MTYLVRQDFFISYLFKQYSIFICDTKESIFNIKKIACC
ncbi:hypothetical protein OENI_20150 [Oenococcus oeni]|nr:hypothetical protein OENI_20150 [Oenococcus oeni]